MPIVQERDGRIFKFCVCVLKIFLTNIFAPFFMHVLHVSSILNMLCTKADDDDDDCFLRSSLMKSREENLLS